MLGWKRRSFHLVQSDWTYTVNTQWMIELETMDEACFDRSTSEALLRRRRLSLQAPIVNQLSTFLTKMRRKSGSGATGAASSSSSNVRRQSTSSEEELNRQFSDFGNFLVDGRAASSTAVASGGERREKPIERVHRQRSHSMSLIPSALSRLRRNSKERPASKSNHKQPTDSLEQLPEGVQVVHRHGASLSPGNERAEEEETIGNGVRYAKRERSNSTLSTQRAITGRLMAKIDRKRRSSVGAAVAGPASSPIVKVTPPPGDEERRRRFSISGLLLRPLTSSAR